MLLPPATLPFRRTLVHNLPSPSARFTPSGPSSFENPSNAFSTRPLLYAVKSPYSINNRHECSRKSVRWPFLVGQVAIFLCKLSVKIGQMDVPLTDRVASVNRSGGHTCCYIKRYNILHVARVSSAGGTRERSCYYFSCSGSRPSSAARTAAWVRSETPSLPITRCM